MSFDAKYLVWGLSYAIAGMGLGIYMAASHNHAQHVTHAHLLLVGFVVSLIYAVIHKLWLKEAPKRLAGIQFFIHQAGVVVMVFGLLLLFGGVVAEAKLDPVLALASISVFSGMVLMLAMVVRSRTLQSQ